jgi:hypothetical protein
MKMQLLFRILTELVVVGQVWGCNGGLVGQSHKVWGLVGMDVLQGNANLNHV